MAKMIFINLPVSDLARSTAFYQAIGAVKNAQFSDDTASCMVFSDTIHVMLMTHDKYRQFTSQEDRRRQDDEPGAALPLRRQPAGGRRHDRQGARRPAAVVDPSPKEDFDFMYGRSFEDPDGHMWEVMWMDVEAAAKAIRAGQRLIEPLKEHTDVKDFPLPVVRRRGRGGREILRFAVAGFQDREGAEEHRSTARPARPARCWWWSSRWPASASWR